MICWEPWLLLLQDGCSFLVHQDGAFEFAEVVGAVGGKLDLLEDQFAFVVELIAFCGDGGVVAGEVEIEIDWVGSFIDDVAGRQGDIEAVAPAAGCFEVDGNGARLVVERDRV